jgi:hypothetical protein
MIHTKEQLNQAITTIRQREPAALVAFVESLLLESTTGIGDYARAFAAADSATAARLISDSIKNWGYRFKGYTYRQADFCAQRLEWTLDAIERCVLPDNPAVALDLLVQFFEGDEGTHHDDLNVIEDAFQRATTLFAHTAARCPPERVQAARDRLLAGDHSDYRDGLRPAPE